MFTIILDEEILLLWLHRNQCCRKTLVSFSPDRTCKNEQKSTLKIEMFSIQDEKYIAQVCGNA